MTVLDFLRTRPDYPDDDVDAQAAYWVAMLGSDRCRPAELKSFDLWREASPENREAFDAIVSALSVSDALIDDADILALRAEALGQGVNQHRATRKGLRYGAVGLVAALALIVVGMTTFRPFGGSDLVTPHIDQIAALQSETQFNLRTSVGERLTRALPDGSTIEVNTDSEIRVDLAENSRDIYLLRGQAIFDVAHDEDRPFTVYAGGRKVTALGTLFEVRLDEAVTQVTLLEGKVRVDEIAVSDREADAKRVAPIELLPGDRLVTASDDKIDKRVTVSAELIESDLSWRQGRHIFGDAKLSHIVSELNRYTTRKIVLSDPAIGELRTSVNFKLGSTRSFAVALEAGFGLSVSDDPANDHITIDW